MGELGLIVFDDLPEMIGWMKGRRGYLGLFQDRSSPDWYSSRFPSVIFAISVKSLLVSIL